MNGNKQKNVNINKKVTFNNCTFSNDCINKTNNTQVDSVKDIGVVMLMYNLLQHSDNYLIISGSLWQYYRNKPVVNDNDIITDFNAVNVTDSSNSKVKITGQ